MSLPLRVFSTWLQVNIFGVVAGFAFVEVISGNPWWFVAVVFGIVMCVATISQLRASLKCGP